MLQRTTRTIALAIVILLAAGCGGDSDDEVATTTTTTEASAPAADGRDQMTFTFTGEDGEEGCRYDGPDEPRVDAVSTMVNESDTEAYVTISRLADGKTADDFHAYLRSLGDEFPVVSPAEHHDASVHDWMQGEWRQLHTVAPGESQDITRSRFDEGSYVAFCWRDAGAGSEVWPATELQFRAAD